MSLKSTDIKVYVHTNINTPTLQDTWGQLAGVLDACLINGYNAPPINNLNVANNVLTITFGVNHNLLAGQVLLLSGATVAKYNREFRIANIPTLTTVQIDLDDTFTEQPTGAISATLPSLGWVKEFSNGGKRAYRNAEVEKKDRPFLRVVDEIDPIWQASYAKYAKVGITENMTDINTMIGLQTPFDATNPDKNWIGSGSGAVAFNGWAKWYYSRVMDVYVNNFFDSDGTTPNVKRWMIIGNGKWFYLLPSQVVSIYPNIYFFGKFESTSSVIYGISSSLQYAEAWKNAQTNNKTPLSSGSSSFLLHIGETMGVRAIGMQSNGNDGPGGATAYFENINQQLVASDVYISRIYNSLPYRAKMPSLKWLMNPYDANYEMRTVENNDSAYLLKTVCATTGTTAANGLIAFQLY